jgi:N-methylhydantoinase A
MDERATESFDAVSMMSEFRIGVDIGGTFTDLVFLRPDGKLDKRKVPSTPSDYSKAIVESVVAYTAEQGFPASSISEIVHATTVATNAILERKGARTALLTTDGFRDVLELRRIRIPLSYDLGWEKPVPLVERALRFGIGERLDAQGQVLTPLKEDDVEDAADQLDRDVEAIAIAYLHSYRNPDHERRTAAILRSRFPDVYLSVSSEVLPEMLEFERTSTTVVNAYVGPLINRYLKRLRVSLAEHSIDCPLLVMQSNGGLISAGAAARQPVAIIESGPAAGVVAGGTLAKSCGHPNIITLDMGGTTTKASIVENGQILRGSEYEVGSPISVSSRLVRGSGYLLRIPVIDVSEVGAGGGSIAALDAGGSLRVGPKSAGASPGPACYGHGNDQPTVTDANLVLGYINPDSLAGGALPVDRALAERAIEERIARRSGLSLLDAAFGIHEIANSNMVRAIRSVSVERGRDPGDFQLMAFGGAGPIHAVGVARALGIRSVLVPPAAGVFSAFGLLRAEVEHHSARSVLVGTRDVDLADLRLVASELRSELFERMREEGYSPDELAVSGFADIRYRGQSSELTVDFDLDHLSEAELRAAEARFEQEFERTYGHRGQHKAFELVTIRLVMTAARRAEHSDFWQPEALQDRPDTMHKVYFGAEHGLLDARVLTRTNLAARAAEGPLLIEEYDTTVVVPPGWRATVDTFGNIVLGAIA